MSDDPLPVHGGRLLFEHLQRAARNKYGKGQILTGRLEGERWEDIGRADRAAFSELMLEAIRVMVDCGYDKAVQINQ